MHLRRLGGLALLVCLVEGGCQLPPDHVAGGLDLAGRDFSHGDLAVDGGVVPPRDLAAFDLTPPSVDGNMLKLDGGTLASLWITVIDGDNGLPVPARVIFRPPPGAGFADDILHGPYNIMSPGSATGAVVGPGVLGSPEGVLLETGMGVVPVPAGSYDLFITRGPEYEAVTQHIDVTAGQIQHVDAELARSVDTRGWLAADMHVHTGISYDSKMPIDRRIISMVSNGVELIVSTEHNISIDFAPYLAQLGYTGMAGSVVGDEFNFGFGHGGAYPVTYNASLPAGGVPTWTTGPNGMCRPGTDIECTLGPQAFDMMHALVPSTTVITINHPWWGTADLGYFTNLPWGAGTSNPLPAPLPVAGMFEALEVLNGYWARSDAESYLVADWFYLLSQGYRVTALGNSDTHKINWVRAGWPRTWLRLPTDNPSEVDGAMLADAIRHQRAIASTGPFATLTVDGAQIGDTVIPKTPGQVTVDVTVDAPDWIGVDTVRVYVSGALKHTFAVTAGSRPVFQTSFVEPISGDDWFVVQASGKTSLPADVVGEYGNEMLPFVLTNPVFVDGNGDGVWQPPAWAGMPAPFMGMPTSQPLSARARPPADGVIPDECEPGLAAHGDDARYRVPPEKLLMPLLYP